MTITFNEVEKAILDGLYGVKAYGEVKNGNVSVIVQAYQNRQWRVQFYHADRGLIVLAERVVPNDIGTLEWIHEALKLLEDATDKKVERMKAYTECILVVRKKGDMHEKELYQVKSVNEYLQILELLSYDENVVKILDGNGHYPTIERQLEPYTFAVE